MLSILLVYEHTLLIEFIWTMHREGRSRPNSSQIQETLLYTWVSTTFFIF